MDHKQAAHALLDRHVLATMQRFELHEDIAAALKAAYEAGHEAGGRAMASFFTSASPDIALSKIQK
jgi:hypothetical protein